MTSIIKNQILKYLSRYFKNLSHDKINFNTIKGEGEIADLELDEIALTDLLELPAWMRITSAKCNKVKFSIPWTRLKSEPMIWNLDEVKVKTETCETLRTPDEAFTNLLQSPGKYNFIIRTVDSMTINVNTVSVDFNSSTFTASLQILRIEVESKSSAWEKCNLRHTRIKDSKRGQILLFKEVKWQNLRIEAKSITEKDLPPLRLLTNDAVCRIIIKKRLSDCFIMGSKLVLILKQLLWVLTDSQLKAALHFLDFLSGLIRKANEIVRKKKAARKLEVLPEYQAQVSQQATLQKKSAISHIFSCHDVIETSYHFIAQKIDLHLSDDPGPERSEHPELQKGASIQIELSSFQIDYYPYHLAVKDRDHWGLYKTARYPHPQWLLQSQDEFRNLLLSLVEDDFPTSSSVISRTSISQNGVSYQALSSNNRNLRNYLNTQFNKIMTSCTVLRIGDFVIHKVTSISKKELPKEFIKADKERYKLPETEIIHVEFTYFYYPGDTQFPLPPPKFYVQVYPVQIHFDVLTLIWLNTFCLNLHKSLLTTSTAYDQQSNSQLFYFDVRMEITMPQIIFEINEEKNISKDRPRSFLIEISKISVTNTRTNSGVSSKSNLAKMINIYQMKNLFLSDNFPSKSSDFHVITDKFINHVQGKDNIRNFPSKLTNVFNNEEEISTLLFQELLWIEARDMWCIHVESIWGDFGGVRAVGNNKVPFLDTFPLTVWLHMDPFLNNCNDKIANIQVLTSITNLISVQINKYQAKFLSKMFQHISELTTFLTLDADKTMKGSKSATIVIASVIPQIEVTLVTSSQDFGKGSSGGDIESSSVVPDSSSLDTHSAHWTNTVQNSLDKSTEDTFKSNTKHKGNTVVNFVQDDLILNKSRSGDAKPFSHLKKNLSSFMSIDFSSKSVDESYDTISIRSDDSSDTENYLMRSGSDQFYLDDSDAMFKINYRKKPRNVVSNYSANIEIADEALNEYIGTVETPITTPSEKDSIASIYKRKYRVAATTFKLTCLEFMLQSTGLNSLIKIQIDNVGIEECYSIPWDELQNKFSSRIRNWCEIEDIKSDVVSQARIKLRLENEIHPPKVISEFEYNIDQWRSTNLDVTIKNLSLELQEQTINGITEFLEDQKSELNDTQIHFEILIDNVKLFFKQDPSEFKDDTKFSPVIFKKLQIFRDHNGVINVQPVEKNFKEYVITDIDNTNIQSMKTEIELLRKRLTSMSYIKEENETLRQYQEENTLLRNYLIAAQNQIADLLEQRRELLERASGLHSSHLSENSSCKR